MIISLSGYIGSGKDTAGKIIQWLFRPPIQCTIEEWLNATDDYRAVNNWQIKKWASLLRKVAAILLGMNEQFLYTDEFKQMILPEQWWYYNDQCTTVSYGSNISKMDGYNTALIKTTGRAFLQKLGTDAIRDGLHENAWVNALMSEYIPHVTKENTTNNEWFHVHHTNYSKWIITDTRFPNELKAVKNRDGVTIHINRKFTQVLGIPIVHASETSLDNAKFDYIVSNDSTIEELTEKLKSILLLEGLLK